MELRVSGHEVEAKQNRPSPISKRLDEQGLQSVVAFVGDRNRDFAKSGWFAETMIASNDDVDIQEGALIMWLVGTGKLSGNLPFRLIPGNHMVGRAKTNQIVIADATVSRKHAMIICTKRDIAIEDLASANGIFVNERRIVRCVVEVGNCVRFGGISCTLSQSPICQPAQDNEESTLQIPNGHSMHVESLTVTQQDVVAHLLQGESEAEIASHLGRSPHTIHTHLKTIFRRLAVHSRAELIMKLLRRV